DKDTSGVLVAAKSDLAHRGLSRQIKDRRVVKKYLALVQGRVAPPEGEINAPIGRHPGNRKLMTIVPDGRHAVTRYRVVQYLAGYTLVEAQPVTGRTHQIRVHFASRGHPIIGDTVYGKASPLLGRQFLHAHRLGFQMPDSGLYKEFEALLPEDLQQTLDSLSTS
ncbi:MAG: RluA family pseudouridine synthase, partial [Chloroflexi bacterium]|nr:RluA family pseudouridine synthase [Chloroflexota bacterium]